MLHIKVSTIDSIEGEEFYINNVTPYITFIRNDIIFLNRELIRERFFPEYRLNDLIMSFEENDYYGT